MAGKGLERKVELPRIKPRAPVMAILRSLIRPSLIGLQTKSIRVPTIGIPAVSMLKIHLNQLLSLLNLPRPRPIGVYIHRMAECPCICSCRCSWRRLPRKPLHPAAVCMGRGEGREGYRGHQITGTALTTSSTCSS